MKRRVQLICLAVVALASFTTQVSAAPTVCPRCVFNPLEIRLDDRALSVRRMRFTADPSSRYVLSAADDGSAGVVVTVVLNGVRVVDLRDLAGPRRDETRVNVRLDFVNEIVVTVIGRRGRSASVWVESKPPRLEDCGGELTFFTALPTPLEQLRAVRPLGDLSPPGHTLPIHHINPQMKVIDPLNPVSDPVEGDVVAPGRARLVAMEHGISSDGRDDFNLHLQPCRQVRIYLLHLNALAPQLAARVGDITAGVCSGGQCAKLVDVAIEAGERLGTAGRPGFFGYDIGLVDKRRGPLPFANPDRYALSALGPIPPELLEFAETVAPDRINQFCALDYFRSDLRTQLESLLGKFDGSVRRVVPPLCGQHMQDLPGTAQGNWFLRDTSSAFFEDDETLALVHDSVDPAIPVFSTSNAIPGWTPAPRSFTPRPAGFINRDFSSVHPGAVYCYQDFSIRDLAEPGVALVEVFSEGASVGNAVRIERKPAAPTCAAAFPWTFSPAAIVFRR